MLLFIVACVLLETYILPMNRGLCKCWIIAGCLPARVKFFCLGMTRFLPPVLFMFDIARVGNVLLLGERDEACILSTTISGRVGFRITLMLSVFPDLPLTVRSTAVARRRVVLKKFMRNFNVSRHGRGHVAGKVAAECKRCR